MYSQESHYRQRQKKVLAQILAKDECELVILSLRMDIGNELICYIKTLNLNKIIMKNVLLRKDKLFTTLPIKFIDR